VAEDYVPAMMPKKETDSCPSIRQAQLAVMVKSLNRLMITLPLAAVMLSMLVTACSTLSSDNRIRREVVGTWIPMSHPSRVIETRPDGSFVCTDTINATNVSTIRGSWQVNDGFMLMTGTNASPPIPELKVERYRVVRIDDAEMVLRRDGQTNLLVAHKQ
jgi:hypothetical protein